MILLDVNKLSEETIIEIGKDLNILPKDAEVTKENVAKVVSATFFAMSVSLPTYVVHSDINKASFKLEVNGW